MHLLVNGDLAHVILFGLFALYAVLGMRMIDRRNRRLWGEGLWITRASGTSNLPFQGNWQGFRPALWRIALAAIVWIGLLHLHLPVIGVSPMP